MSWTIAGDEKNGLLDIYTEAAAAYSLRNLAGRAGKSANVVRVRRSSDNTEQDFTAAQVTDGTLTTFCGAGNGFVRTWYDQSGAGLDLGQTTTANQPQIINSGSLILEGSKPALSFDGTNDRLFNVGSISLPSPLSNSVFAVIKTPQGLNNTFRTVYEFANLQRVSFQLNNLAGLGFIAWADSETATVTPSQFITHATTRQSLSIFWNGSAANVASSYTARRNGSSQLITQGIGTSGLGRIAGISLGARNDGTQPTELICQEFIVYRSNQSSTASAIETNINAHYAIY
jgi:hypothetical protein